MVGKELMRKNRHYCKGGAKNMCSWRTLTCMGAKARTSWSDAHDRYFHVQCFPPFASLFFYSLRYLEPRTLPPLKLPLSVLEIRHRNSEKVLIYIVDTPYRKREYFSAIFVYGINHTRDPIRTLTGTPVGQPTFTNFHGAPN